MPRLPFVTAILLGFAACYGSTQSTESAGPVPTPPDTDDPPGHVGRLALFEGAVSFRPAAGDTWAIPAPNRPVTTGDALWVDSVGHAEVEIGPNALRASNETEVDVVHLDDDMLQIRVPQGSVDLRIKEIDMKKDYEIDAPNAAVVVDQAGEYRIDVSPSGDTTRVTTWSGHAQVTANGSTFPVEASQTATVRGDSAAGVTYDLAAAGAPDAFDQWSHQRNDREDRVGASAQYATADVSGLEDLDAYGAWSNDPDYGAVWYPTSVEVGWAPYSYGDWVWADPWGWTWVDSYPWGWAPFHYGRWAWFGSRWGWCPGVLGYEAYWSPGLVEFVGGGGWGLGVGWFPLAPHEYYNPWYRTGLRYRERLNVNITNVTTVTYRNRGIAGAVTAVPTRSFASGEAIGRGAVHPSGAELSGAGVLGAGPGVAPTRGSLVGSRGFEHPSAVPPARLATRSVVALHAPPPAPVRFSSEERAIAANGGRPLTESERSNIRETEPSARMSEPAFHSAATGRGLSPARPGLPASTPISRGMPARTGRTSLDQSFGTERQQLESRHIQEFANPRANESRAQMYQRQEAEHRELVNRYNTARSSGLSRMPAAAPRGGGGHHR